MEIKTLELLIAVTKSKLLEMPENEEIEGLEGDAGKNFRKLSDALNDAEDTLNKMKNAKAVRKLLGE